MKLTKAIELLNGDRLDYMESFKGSVTGVDRAGTLSRWVDFRANYGCPDVDQKERKALKAVNKYVAKIQQDTLDQLGQTYTCC
jgi:hypothetical protein